MHLIIKCWAEANPERIKIWHKLIFWSKILLPYCAHLKFRVLKIKLFTQLYIDLLSLITLTLAVVPEIDLLGPNLA